MTASAKALTIRDIAGRKGGEKLVMVTAYDALFARLVDESGVDMILVGDSLGNVVAGYDSTQRRSQIGRASCRERV